MAKKSQVVLVPKMALPKSDMHKAFCEAWLKHFDHKKACLEAGYSRSWCNKNNPKKLLDRYLMYLTERRQALERRVSKELALEQKDILAAMYAIASSNVQDYVKEVEEEEEITDESGLKHKVLVKRIRQKSVLELTREQASALSEITCHPNGTVTYKLPDERSKHPYWKDLGQHLGLFHPKLIAEHRHEHRHRVLSFRDMDSDKLAKAERFLMEAMGQEGRRMLGVMDAEFEDITPET